VTKNCPTHLGTPLTCQRCAAAAITNSRAPVWRLKKDGTRHGSGWRAWRNWDFDSEKSEAYNAEELMCI